MPGNLYPHVITIKAKTTTNTNGGQVISYAASYSNVASLIAPANGTQRLLYSQRGMVLTHEIYTETLIGVNQGDIVVYGSRQFFVLAWFNVLEGRRLYQLDVRELASTELIVEGP